MSARDRDLARRLQLEPLDVHDHPEAPQLVPGCRACVYWGPLTAERAAAREIGCTPASAPLTDAERLEVLQRRLDHLETAIHLVVDGKGGAPLCLGPKVTLQAALAGYDYGRGFVQWACPRCGETARLPVYPATGGVGACDSCASKPRSPR